MPYKNDVRYKTIGHKHRAEARYYMMCNRCNSETDKNRSYVDVEVILSKEYFITWFMERDFEGCSVDRVDSKGNYELSNMQVICLYLKQNSLIDLLLLLQKLFIVIPGTHGLR